MSMNEEKLKGKRLLVLGGAIQCSKVVEAAKAMGVYTIVTDRRANERVVAIADETLPFSVTDSEAILAWCRAHPVDGVINFCIDYAQHTHQKVCAALGLPSYGTPYQYHVLTDKAAFKAFCRENGVDVIEEYEEDELDRVEYPVLVKPSESSGSRGSCVCHSREELLPALAAAKAESKNAQAIIEKYMGGKPDFSCAYIVINGEPYLYRTVDRYLGTKEDNLNRQCIFALHCSKYTDMYLKNVHDRVCRMIRRLGLQNTPLLLQGFVDGDTVRFYDQGIRFSGAEYERIIKRCTGVDVVKAFVGYALGEDLSSFSEQMKDIYAIGSHYGIQLFLDLYPGKIASINGMEEVAKLPFVDAVMQKHFVGDVIPDSGDVKQRAYEIIIVVKNDLHAVINALDKIQKRVDIRDDQGRNMLTPLIDPSRLFA